MSYAVSCPCGRSIEVSASQAGSIVLCVCGESVSVPSLSKMRTQAGQGAFESGILDTINRMIDSGELPWGDVCAVCGMPTRDILEVWIQCELQTFEGTVSRGKTLLSWLSPWRWPINSIAFLYPEAFRSRQNAVQVRGHDRGVHIPLRVRQEHHAQVRRMRQSHLRKLLNTVPVLAKLLEQYPAARVEPRA